MRRDGLRDLALLAAVVATFAVLGFVVGRDASCVGVGAPFQRWEIGL